MFVKDRRMVKCMSECGWMMFNVGWSQLYVITKIKPWASLSILTLDPSSESLSDSIVEAFFSELVAPNAPANSGLIHIDPFSGCKCKLLVHFEFREIFPSPWRPRHPTSGSGTQLRSRLLRYEVSAETSTANDCRAGWSTLSNKLSGKNR